MNYELEISMSFDIKLGNTKIEDESPNYNVLLWVKLIKHKCKKQPITSLIK